MSDDAQHPESDEDHEGWKAYRAAQGMPWRTEPEIDDEREPYTSEWWTVPTDNEWDTSAFKDIALTSVGCG